jgi:uncharacterized membrane protein YkvA (DUF1232 family)
MSKSEAPPADMQFYRKLRKTIKIWIGEERSRASRYADYILAGPDLFVLMVRLARDDRVSSADKARLAGAIAYFVNPMDFIPEAVLGPAGLVDDVAVASLVLRQLLERVDPAIIREHWDGDADVLDLIRQILAVADTMVGGPVWRRLVARVEGFVSAA